MHLYPTQSLYFTKMNPVKNDWVNSLDKNKKEYEIMLDDDQLKSKFKTKDSFKNYLKKRIENC